MFKNYLSILIAFFSLLSYAQNTIDSLKQIDSELDVKDKKSNLYYELCSAYSRINADSALFYARKSIEHSRKEKTDSLIPWAHYQIGEIFQETRVQLDSALYYADKGLEMVSGNKRTVIEIKLNGLKANVLTDQGKFNKAVAYYSKNVDLADMIGNSKKKAWSYSGIAETYRLQKNGSNSVKYAELAMGALNPLAPDYALSKLRLGLNLALAYDINDQLEKSTHLLRELITTSSHYSSFQQGIVHHNLGRALIKNTRYIEAEQILLKTLTFDEWVGIPRRKLATLKELVTLYSKTNRLDEAVVLGTEVYQLAHELEIRHHIEDATRNLSDIYEARGEDDKAIRYSNEYIAILKNIFDDRTNELILEMDARFESREKQKSIDKLEAKSKIDKRNRIILTVSLISLLFISLLSIRLVKRRQHFRVKEQEYALEQEQNKHKIIALQLEQEQLVVVQQRQEKDIVDLELELKQKELTTNAISLLQKKEQFDLLLEGLQGLKGHVDSEGLRALKSLISETKASLVNYNWDEFQHLFEKVHVNFYDKLLDQYPALTPNEKKLSAFLKLGMSTKDISAITNQSLHSILIARSRLRKKLGLKKNENLTAFMAAI